MLKRTRKIKDFNRLNPDAVRYIIRRWNYAQQLESYNKRLKMVREQGTRH